VFADVFEKVSVLPNKSKKMKALQMPIDRSEGHFIGSANLSESKHILTLKMVRAKQKTLADHDQLPAEPLPTATHPQSEAELEPDFDIEAEVEKMLDEEADDGDDEHGGDDRFLSSGAAERLALSMLEETLSHGHDFADIEDDIDAQIQKERMECGETDTRMHEERCASAAASSGVTIDAGLLEERAAELIRGGLLPGDAFLETMLEHREVLGNIDMSKADDVSDPFDLALRSQLIYSEHMLVPSSSSAHIIPIVSRIVPGCALRVRVPFVFCRHL
jgi:hypothetical protein